MDNFIKDLKDSVEKSVTNNYFNSFESSMYAHIFKSSLKKLKLSLFTNVENFNPERLKSSASKAFPKNDRPRGDDNLKSIKYHQKNIRKEIFSPIWVIKKDGKYILLDGTHRIVANFIEGKKYIYTYLIKL